MHHRSFFSELGQAVCTAERNGELLQKFAGNSGAHCGACAGLLDCLNADNVPGTAVPLAGNMRSAQTLKC